MTDFSSFGLTPALLRSIEAIGFKEPTPIQRDAIPPALEGNDVLGLAQTGTGKTAAFSLPLIQQLLKMHGKPEPKTIRALILAPTRELVGQIAEHIETITKKTPLKTARVVGGLSINMQSQRLAKGTDIVVATPGRLLDLVERKAVRLETAQFLVLDEADQMLDLGFIHALKRIAGLLGKERQTMLFSATMPKSIEQLSATFLRNPVRIEVSPPGRTVDRIEQSLYHVTQRQKLDLLIELLGREPGELRLVFSRTKHGAEKLMKKLVQQGFKAASIHGNKSQNQRDRAIKDFRAGKTEILVATDVAARGIDIPDVATVYNFDLPEVAESYVHRIGRTARAGKDGKAIAFVGAEDGNLLRGIEKLMGQSIPLAEDSAEPGEVRAQARAENGGVDPQKPKRNRGRGNQGGRGNGAGPKAAFARKDGDNQQRRRPRGSGPNKSGAKRGGSGRKAAASN